MTFHTTVDWKFMRLPFTGSSVLIRYKHKQRKSWISWIPSASCSDFRKTTKQQEENCRFFIWTPPQRWWGLKNSAEQIQHHRTPASTRLLKSAALIHNANRSLCSPAFALQNKYMKNPGQCVRWPFCGSWGNLLIIVPKLLSIIFEKLWQSSEVPFDWKRGNITPTFKKGKQEDP